LENIEVAPPNPEREAARRGIAFLNLHFPMFHLDLKRLNFLEGPNSPLEQLMPGENFFKILKDLDFKDIGGDGAWQLGFRVMKSHSWTVFCESNKNLIAAWRYEWPRMSSASAA